MNRQMSNSLRRYGSRSLINLKSDPQFKSIIQEELKDLVATSVKEYLKNNKIPVASIDIRLDKDCHRCGYGENTRRDNGRDTCKDSGGVRLDISTGAIDHEESKCINNKFKTEVMKKVDEDDNVHWMTWKNSLPCSNKTIETENYRIHTAHNLTSNEHKCSTPFMRPSTCSYNNYKPTFKESTLHHRPCSRDSFKRYRCMSAEHPMASAVKKTSVAVGPDKHYNTTSTNTQQSYQISDYLKKSMDLNDPYERKIFSSLMDVLRKKNRNPNSVDSESIAADPIIQISEYKSKFRNPQNKPTTFPTSKTDNNLNIKRPPLCPHKTRPLGQLRPTSTTYPRHQHGEQFLY